MESFEDIAVREGKGERYVRRLSALAFLSPKLIRAIAEGEVASGTSVSSLTANLPVNWSEQEQAYALN